MNKAHKQHSVGVLLLIFLGILFSCASSGDDSGERIYYAIEMNGQAMGYQEIMISRAEEDGRRMILIKETGRALLSALGAKFDTQTQAEYRLDPEGGQLISCEIDVDQESIKLHISASVEGDTVRIELQPGGGEKKVALQPGMIFENPVYFPHLLKDFVEAGLETKRYRILDLADREIQDVTYAKKATEFIQLGGKTYRAVVLDSLNHKIGLKLRLWINADNGYVLKVKRPRNVSSLADKSVKNKIRRASLDNHILARAGASISDIQALSYLKARASLEPIGDWITPESLNVTGQTFEGTVEDNRVEGVFEVRHARYDGRNAPPFPPDFGNRPELQPFLSPEDFVESDDPVLIQKAMELTAGAADSWEAAMRLSQWVADNIGYDIPGGASARKTYDIKEGECGAHSRLFAAFCRAVGIPARVVWGCMFTANSGGSFGQHGWNEIYMGEAGWIPIDTTAREIDFADSGHIRLGILSSAHTAWNPKTMEILDFEAGSQKFGQVSQPGDLDKYQPYLGRYQGPRGVFTMLVQNGSLAVDIPGRMIFELRDPDEESLWYFKLTRDVSISFQENSSGRVTGFALVNKARIPKKTAAEDIDGDVPEEFRPYLGQYPIPMEKTEISVMFRKGHLAIRIPGQGTFDFEGPDDEGMWINKSGGDRVSFVKDDYGKVRSMIIHEVVRCTRID